MKQALYNYSRLLTVGLIIASVSFLSGCKSTPKEENEKEETSVKADPDKDVVAELSGYPVPTSYEVTKHIYESGARYNLHISNGPEKAGDYVTQRDKVLNLGVYAADLCYATTYMMKQGTLNYLEASKVLIEDLGISTTFNINYAERIEDNISNRDSLIIIIEESFHDTWTYMVENKQDVMARLVVSGSWIEGVYLTTKVAPDADDDTVFLEALARQKGSLEELVELLEPVRKAEEVKDIYEALTDLMQVYQEVGEVLTQEQFESIAEKIDDLRSSIV